MGPAATFANGTGATTVNTDSGGLATSTSLTANGTAGTFTVIASPRQRALDLGDLHRDQCRRQRSWCTDDRLGDRGSGKRHGHLDGPGLEWRRPHTGYTVMGSPGGTTNAGGIGHFGGASTLTAGTSYTFTVVAHQCSWSKSAVRERRIR